MESSLKIREAKACNSKTCKWCDIDARVGEELKKLHAAVVADREAKITCRRSLEIPSNVDSLTRDELVSLSLRMNPDWPTNHLTRAMLLDRLREASAKEGFRSLAKAFQQGSCNDVGITLADREATLDKGPAVVVPSAKKKPSSKLKPSAKKKPSLKMKPSAKHKPSLKQKPSAKRKRIRDLGRLLERKGQEEEVQEVKVQEDSATTV